MILLNKSLVICVIVLLFSDVFCCERQFGITCVTFARHEQCGSADVSSVGFRVFIVEVGLGGGGGLSCITTNCQCLHPLLLLCN